MLSRISLNHINYREVQKCFDRFFSDFWLSGLVVVLQFYNCILVAAQIRKELGV